MKKIRQKKGQVTIFIIVAIVMVSAILVYFLWLGPTYFSKNKTKLNFESCVKDTVQQSIAELGANGGLIKPQFTYQYKGEQFTYLCYTNKYYKTCTVQIPFPENTFQKQMKILIKDKINVCYSNAIDGLKSQGYSVAKGKLDYNVSVEPDGVAVKIKAPTVVGSQSFARFNVRINSKIYGMMMIATSIVQSEARYGDFDVSTMMQIYPNYIINKIKRADGTTVYIITNKLSKGKFQFASRSLAWPAGYDFK